MQRENETAIRRLTDDLVTAWNAGDGDAYGRPFTEDCDYVTFSGLRLRGRASVAQRHQALFNGDLSGSILTFENIDMRQLNDDTILVHVIGDSVLANRNETTPSRRSILTLVAIRSGEGWLFAAFHNTRISG